MKQLNFFKIASYTWLLLFISTAFSFAQGPITLSLQYKSSDNKYHVYLKPTSTPTGTSANLTDGSSTITITAPAGLVTMGTVTSVTPVSSWSLVTTALASGVTVTDQGTGTPTGKDFFVFAPSADFSTITYTSGAEVELFSFSATGICSGDLDILPSTGQTSGNGTLNIGSYYSVDGYAGGIGTNHFVGKYNMVSAVPTAPTLALASPSTICSGSSTTLSASCSTGTLAWYTNAGLTGTALASNTVSPTSTTTYYGTCDNGTCKSLASNVTVTVNATPATPTLALASPATICSGSSTTLSASCSTGTLAWYTNAGLTGTGLASNTVSPTSTTIYYGTCDNGTCKSAASSVVVTVNATPSAPTLASASPATICSGSSTTLSANCSTGTLAWYTNAGLTGTGLASNTVSPTSTTTYYGTCDNGTCKSLASSVVVTVNATPAAPTAVSATQGTICSGSSTTLSATCSTGTLAWYTNAGLTGTALASNTVSPTSTTTYYATCETATCKSLASNVVVTVNATPAAPTAVSASPATICSGSSTTLSANCSTGTLAWYTNAGLTGTALASSTVSPTSTTIYYATCETATCKSAASTVTVTVNVSPTTPSLSIVDPTCVVTTGSITVIPPAGTFEYSLNGGLYQASVNFTGLAPGAAYSIVARNTSTLCVSAATTGTIAALPSNCIVKVSPKALLQGAGSMIYSSYTANVGGLMRDNLRSSGLIPTNEPYTALGFTTPAIPSSTVSSAVLGVTGTNAIVDWVLVELRDAITPTTIIARKAALIQVDGDIVETDGVSPVSFGVTNGNYKVAVLHRNHLGVMTAGNLALTSTTTIVDFTSLSTLVNGTNAQVTISGKNYLWAGNTNGNTSIIAQGASSDRSTVTNAISSASGNTSNVNTFIVNGYRSTDVNMDGKTIAQGLNADNSYILNLIINHPSNTTNRSNIFIITQQLP